MYLIKNQLLFPFESDALQLKIFRRGHAQPILNEIVNNKNDKESKICLQTIDYMTNMISNFVKYG